MRTDGEAGEGEEGENTGQEQVHPPGPVESLSLPTFSPGALYLNWNCPADINVSDDHHRGAKCTGEM